MARGGVNKAVVQKARAAILARGEHPSIDAVRIEMGNTGSKTTIHRYLKELDEGDTRSGAPQAEIGEELTDLVARLAQRLRDQAQEGIDQAQAALDARLLLMREELARVQGQLTELTERHGNQTSALETQTTTLLATQTSLQAEHTSNARLSQACQDMESRLQDKDEQIRSLEEKHLHARDALEHYRSAIKEQRDQEQRRHEGQVQQLQMELRQAQQSAMVRQEEITQLNRDNERLLAEARSQVRELGDHQQQLSKAHLQITDLSTRHQQSETRCALLQERLNSSVGEGSALKERLTEQEQQNRVLELILIKTEVALENVRAAQAAAEAAANTPAPEA